jgi:hypothetical protein
MSQGHWNCCLRAIVGVLFWLKARTSERGGGAYAKPRPASCLQVAGGWLILIKYLSQAQLLEGG